MGALRLALSAIAVAGVSASACAPTWTLRGTVVERDAAGEERPISNATVRLICDERVPEDALEDATDELGGFDLGGDGPGPSRDCTLRIEHAGHQGAELSIGSACLSSGAEGACASAEAHVVLSSRGAALEAE